MALTFPSFNNNPATTSTFSFGSSSAFGNAASSAPAFTSFSSSSLGSSLFSSSSSAQPSSSSSFPSFSFSNPAASSASSSSVQPSSFGSSSLSFSYPSTSTPAPQPLSLTSSYSSLPDDVRAVFVSLERHIRQQTTLADELNAALPAVGKADGVGSVSVSVSSLSNALVELRVLMSEDMERVEAVQREVETDIRQAEGSHRRGMRLVHVGQGGQTISHMQDTLYLPSHFHWQRLLECEKRLAAVRSEMADVEACLLSAQSPSTAASQQHDSLAALASVLQNQHNLLVDVSSRISALHSQIDAQRIARTARNPTAATDDSRRLLTSAPKNTLDSFGVLTAASTPSNTGTASYAPPAASASPPAAFSTSGWNAAPSMGAGGSAGGLFGAPPSTSSSPFSFSQSSFSGPSAGTAAVGPSPSFSSGFGQSSVPSLPSAPPSLTSSISATAEGGHYRTIRSGVTSSKTSLRKK